MPTGLSSRKTACQATSKAQPTTQPYPATAIAQEQIASTSDAPLKELGTWLEAENPPLYNNLAVSTNSLYGKPKLSLTIRVCAKVLSWGHGL